MNEQKEAYKPGKLTADQISRLESITGWSWQTEQERN
jgi:hypothetical protein